MRWHRQVFHVARKDVRLMGWLILAYAVVVGGSTAAAVDRGIPATSSPLWIFALVVLGMLLCALLVQADSPATSNAFWVSRPLSPLAVFSAKLLVAVLLLLGVPLVGQSLGLLAHAVAAREIPGLLAESALSYGWWLGMAAVIAALTRDLRTFVVALVLFAVGWFVGMLAIDAHLDPTTRSRTPPPLLVDTAVICGMLLLLAHQYVTRDVRRGAWIAGMLALGSMLLPRVVSRSLPAATNDPDDLRPVAIRIDEVRLQRMVGGRVQARLRLRLDGASEFHRYRLASPVVLVHGASGSMEAIAIEWPYFSLRTPDLPATRGFRWIDGHNPAQDHTPEVGIDLAPNQREALSGGGARLTLRGRIEVYEPRVVAMLPLIAGAAAARDGYSVRIEGVTGNTDGLSVGVRVSSVTSARTPVPVADDLFAWNSDSYALLNPARREAVALTTPRSSSSDLALVLPGPRSEVKTMQLGPTPGFRETDWGEIDEEWLRGARLLLLRWAPLGSYPVDD